MQLDEVAVVRTNYHDLVRMDVFGMVPRSGGTLLDVGGGVGATAAALKQAGYVERAGVVDLVRPAMTAEGLDFVITGDLEDSEAIEKTMASKGPFEVILCLDVLEHLRDPWRLVQSLHRVLAPGGVIIASIPNVRYYTASWSLFFLGTWDMKEAGVRDRTHLRWFVRKTAADLMTSSGLTLEEVVGKAGGGRKIRMVRALTLGLFNEFTNAQYLIRVRKA